jgi:LL-diaminopimelate aminotransferase
MTKFSLADRVASLPPYLFAAIDKAKAEAAARGVDIISLGIGDPDMPTPPFIIEAFKEAAMRPANHRYPSYEGMATFRQAVSDWYVKRFGVTGMNPNGEIICTIGSKEAIGHFPFAFVNPNDLVLVPSPGYPVYSTATRFAGGRVKFLPLTDENGFLPDIDSVNEATWQEAKIIWVNYPNNPTSAIAPRSFYEKLINICLKYNVILAHDAAYSDIYFDENDKPVSIFNIPGGKDVSVEFLSLSKTFNMTGWRVGMVAGNAQLVGGLGKIKENMDSGTFNAVQEAAIAAMREGDDFRVELCATYKKRRDAVCAALNKTGIKFREPKASFYVWAQVPDGFTSAGFVTRVLNETGVVVTPGSGFGEAGEGYFRISLTVDTSRLEEAMHRISKIG